MGGYQDRKRRCGWLAAGLVVMGALAVTGCGAGRGRTGVASIPGARGGADVVAQARAYTGTAYRSGGTTPAGFDCSGFVQYLYAQIGVALPRTAAAQFDVGASIAPRAIAPGDLVFFRTEGRRVSHVGVATGDGHFIHAPNARSHVRVDRLDAAYWDDRFAGARRVVEQ